MFAFIVTLGIVVDDAVVVGEHIYHNRRQGRSFLQAATAGAKEVAMPVVFSVLTNVVAFMPLWFVPGVMGKIFKTIPLVVACVFGVSLIESLFVLPAHLSHRPRGALLWPLNHLEKWQARFSMALEHFIQRRYGALLGWILKNRVAMIALSIAILMATAGYVTSGRMGMVMFPEVESEFAFCKAVLPYGASRAKVKAVESRLISAAQAVAAQSDGEPLSEGIASQVDENTVQVFFYLTDPGIRTLSTAQVSQRWRERLGTLPGLEAITFSANRGGPGSGKNLTIQLSHRDKEALDQAGADLAARLAEYTIVHDIDDGSAKGKRQYAFHLQPAGERMGLTSQEVASQVRAAFQGATAVQQQRGRNEVSVRVRLPETERVAEATLDKMVLQAPRGEILLRDAVSMIPGRAFTQIERTGGRRVLTVTGNASPPSQAESIQQTLATELLPELEASYPGLSYSFQGHQAEIRDSLTSLITGLGLSLMGIYALLAIPFRSYLQPLIIMFCIPFGMIGAIWGHLLMGYSLAVNSLFGVVALSGVVVNDSLVMIDFANRRRGEGVSPRQAIWSAGIQRFRPILLTTLTTFGGLTPIIMETSIQARFMIPMAISLGFGIVFATFITLVMVPCLYLLLEDMKQWFVRRRSDPGANLATETIFNEKLS
jgi:multidrug efflux pump subunit AcrB